MAMSPGGAASPKPASGNQAPPGFHALFNGTDLTGWWGGSTEDPRQYMAMPPAEFQKKHDATVILDADLGKVTEFMGGHPHSGKDRTRGHFGFAGHNDPVMFRNITIKSLN